jgi:hypothetical protein
VVAGNPDDRGERGVVGEMIAFDAHSLACIARLRNIVIGKRLNKAASTVRWFMRGEQPSGVWWAP